MLLFLPKLPFQVPSTQLSERLGFFQWGALMGRRPLYEDLWPLTSFGRSTQKV